MFNGTGSVAYASGTPPAPWLLIGERDRRGGVGNGPLPHRVKPHHPTQPVLLPVDAALGAEPRQDDIQRKLLELDKVRVQSAKQRMERMRTLHSQGFIASPELDEAEASYNEAKAQLEVAEANLMTASKN